MLTQVDAAMEAPVMLLFPLAGVLIQNWYCKARGMCAYEGDIGVI